MTTRDIAQWLDPDLHYPGIPSTAYPKGRTYDVPGPDRETGLRWTVMANIGRRAASGESLEESDLSALDNGDERSFEEQVLGAAYQRMVADGVADANIKTIARDAFYSFTSGEAIADLVLRGEAAARDAARADSKPSKPAAKRPAGSSSSRASGDTPARTRGRASTRSSKTPEKQVRKTA